MGTTGSNPKSSCRDLRAALRLWRLTTSAGTLTDESTTYANTGLLMHAASNNALVSTGLPDSQSITPKPRCHRILPLWNAPTEIPVHSLPASTPRFEIRVHGCARSNRLPQRDVHRRLRRILPEIQPQRSEEFAD